MNFSQAESFLLSLGNEVSAMKLGLENILTLLTALGEPQNNYLKVQVAGTNGKGSVCAFLDAICFTAGIKTGTFTSPHLVSITERIRINGDDISEKDFARHATFIRETAARLLEKGDLEYRPTFFEQITAIALMAFADAKIELAILETGLGGRLDATTAANAEIAAITRIDLDHKEYLGETIEEIAAEKAAIITAETQAVVLGDQSPDVMRLLRKHCNELGIEPLNDGYEPWRILKSEDDTVRVILSMIIWPPIRLGLKGQHQIENAQTAIQLTRALRYHGVFPNAEEGEAFVIDGLQKATHPGRLEYVGKYLLDGAHNVAGARALREYLDEFVDRPITMIFGAMKDKDIGQILEILGSKADSLIFTRPWNDRSLTAHELADFINTDDGSQQILLTDSVSDAIKKANEVAASDGIILITGSLYLVGEAKKIIEGSVSAE